MAGDEYVPSDDADPIRVQPYADHLSRQLARHRITIAVYVDQAGTRHSHQFFNIAVKRCWHRHHLHLFLLQHLGHAAMAIFRVAQLAPQTAAALAQPSIEFGIRAKLMLLRIEPDPPTAILHILFDDSLAPRPTTRQVCRVGCGSAKHALRNPASPHPEATLQKSASNK